MRINLTLFVSQISPCAIQSLSWPMVQHTTSPSPLDRQSLHFLVFPHNIRPNPLIDFTEIHAYVPSIEVGHCASESRRIDPDLAKDTQIRLEDSNVLVPSFLHASLISLFGMLLKMEVQFAKGAPSKSTHWNFISTAPRSVNLVQQSDTKPQYLIIMLV